MNADRTEIRKENTADHSSVYEVVRSAFESNTQAELVTLLRESADPSISLVALIADEIVGHIFFSPVTFEKDTGKSAAQLSPVAVDPVHQGRGIGSKLIRAGLEKCVTIGCSSVFLVGNPSYYSRFDFTPAVPLGFYVGGSLDVYLQVRKLYPDALKGLEGRIYFHPVFDSLEE